jgi:hypothetical protein
MPASAKLNALNNSKRRGHALAGVASCLASYLHERPVLVEEPLERHGSETTTRRRENRVDDSKRHGDTVLKAVEDEDRAT